MAYFDGTNGPVLSLEYFAGSYVGPTWFKFGDGSSNPMRDVKQISIRRGRTREDQFRDPSTMTITFDNLSGQYDPDYLASQNVGNPFGTPLDFNRRIRLTGTINGTTYTIFTGYLQQVDATVDVAPMTTITVTDALNNLAKKIVTYSGGVEQSGTRLYNLVTQTNIATDGVTINAANFQAYRYLAPASLVNANLVTTLKDIVNAEAGDLYITADNQLMFTSYEMGLVDKTSKFTLSDEHTTAGTTTIEYDVLQTNVGAKYSYNTAGVNTPYSQITVDLNGETGYPNYGLSYNASSISLYGATQTNVTVPLQDSASNPAGVGAVLANRFAYPSTRVWDVEFECVGLSTALWQSVLSTDLRDHITVKRLYPPYGSGATWENVVGFIQHDITPDSWRIGYKMEPYRIASAYSFNPSLTKSLFVLNSSKLNSSDVLWF